MKWIYVLFLVLGLSLNAQAKSYSIALHVFFNDKSMTRVTLYSYGFIEGRKNISVQEAVSVIRNARGGTSVNDIGIKVENVPLKDYLPILTAISENPYLSLIAIKTDVVDWRENIIWKMIQDGAQQSAQANASHKRRGSRR